MRLVVRALRAAGRELPHAPRSIVASSPAVGHVALLLASLAACASPDAQLPSGAPVACQAACGCCLSTICLAATARHFEGGSSGEPQNLFASGEASILVCQHVELSYISMKFHLHKLPTTHSRRASSLATAHMQPARAQHEHRAVYLQQDPSNISSSLFHAAHVGAEESL